MAKLILNEARAEQNLAEPSIESNVKYELGEELLKENGTDIYKIIDRDYSPIPISAHHDISNPDELCQTEEFTVVRNNTRKTDSGVSSSKSSQENAYSQFPIRRIHLLPYGLSIERARSHNYEIHSQHEVVQRYGAILLDYLTNPEMKESEAYKTYHDLATGKVQPKPKYVRRSSRTNTDEAPKPSFSKRVKATAKVAKSGKKKQPALGLETLFDIALTEAKQMKLAIKKSKTQLHSSQPSSSGAHEGTGVSPGVPDAPTYQSNDDEISCKLSDEDDDDEVNVSEYEDDDDDEGTESDDDGDDFVHPKFSTHDDEAKQDEEVNEEDSFDPRADMINEEETHEEVKANVLYQDVNVNLEGRDTMMTDAPLLNSSCVSSGFVSKMLNPRPDTGIDSIFTLNTEAISLVDVLVTTIVEPPLVSASILPTPPTPLITHMQQTLVPTPTIVPSSSLQDLPNFSSLFRFDHRLKTLETDFSEFKQTNQFTEADYSNHDIIDAYLANKMHEAVKTDVQLQSDKLIDEALAENEAFLNSLDDNIKKIIKDQVKQQVKA
ncbi:hypothetical protein Tco_0280267 [Tanacetum coccineum]